MSINIAGLLSLLLVSYVCVAQIPSANPTASVSGRVTIDGKGAEGITVVARVADSQLENRTVAKTVTDNEGNYRLTGLAVGSFAIVPIAKAFVVAGSGSIYKTSGQSVNVAENESITKIDFALVRGGVITGRITDPEGRPIIAERVDVQGGEDSDNGSAMAMFQQGKNQTDDRGVYRIYGLGPGSYKVSVGTATAGGSSANVVGMGGSQYIKTFYPGVAEVSKATAIEINEGSEVTNIDITPGKTASGFSVSGLVIDADSKEPVANTYVAYSSVSDENQGLGQMNFTGGQTDANGKFRLEGIQPGQYAAFTLTVDQSNSYSDPEPFSVSSGDVTGIEIKVRRGGTIEGVAVIENNVDPAVAALLQSVSLFTYIVEPNGTSAPSFSRAKINPDGSFRLTGLSPGKARIHVIGFPTPPKGLELVRTELQGLEQASGIEVTAGARITGVRLVFTYGTGKIRGEVKIEGGVLPEGIIVSLYLHSVGGSHQYNRSLQADARGHFVAEDIPPGTYELTARVPELPHVETVSRTITVANGAETQVTLVVNLAAKQDEPE